LDLPHGSCQNAVLLKPLGVPDPDRVVVLGWLGPQGLTPGASPATFDLFSQRTDVLEDFAAFRPVRLNHLGGDEPQQIMAAEVSDGFFRSFALPIVEGRGFLPEETLPGARRVAVISQRMRERSFRPGAGVLGGRIELGGVTYEVIGVTGAGFDLGQLRGFGFPPLAYLPLEIERNSADPTAAFVNTFQVAARLRDGVTLDQIRDRLDASALGFRERFGGARVLPERLTFGAEPFAEYAIGGGARRTLWILAGSVAFVLLIACANTANLFMVRASSRGREMAVRMAIGAGRGRLIRQLLTESVLLFLIAGGLGLGLGIAGIRALLTVGTSGLPRVGPAGALVVLDWRVLTFVLLASLATGLVFGLMPAIAGSRVDVNSSLKDAGQGGRPGAGPGAQAAGGRGDRADHDSVDRGRPVDSDPDRHHVRRRGLRRVEHPGDADNAG
jgi:predicted permease